MAPREATAVPPEPVAALCERVRAIALASGEDALRARREQAEALLAEARRRAAADGEAERRSAEEQMNRQAARERQAARMEARARMAGARWAELDAVLDAAEREVSLIRERDPERYAAALAHFLQAAREQIAGQRLVIEANAEDVGFLRDTDGEVIEADVGAGLVVTTADGNVVCDQTIASRRRRLDGELRLAAAEVLFSQQRGAEE